MIWNCRPRSDYTVTVKGILLGVGTHPALQTDGAWNIFCLITPDLEQYRVTGKVNPDEYPVYTQWVAAAVGTAWLQRPGQVETLGQLAETLTLKEFLEKISDYPGIFFPRVLYGAEAWEAQASAAVELLAKHKDNVIVGRFRK